MTSQTYFELSTEDKIDALEAAASALGRPADLLEKDIWVVWALERPAIVQHVCVIAPAVACRQPRAQSDSCPACVARAWGVPRL